MQLFKKHASYQDISPAPNKTPPSTWQQSQKPPSIKNMQLSASKSPNTKVNPRISTLICMLLWTDSTLLHKSLWSLKQHKTNHKTLSINILLKWVMHQFTRVKMVRTLNAPESVLSLYIIWFGVFSGLFSLLRLQGFDEVTQYLRL